MLRPDQIEFFEENGYLVVENVLDQQRILDPVRAEYAELLDRLYDGWHAEGKLPPPGDMDFFEKLRVAYTSGCDWFQPMDISLPGTVIEPDTPFHFGPAVLNMLTDPKLLDIVESLIGPEITSNPIQHVRIKPPRTELRDGETRAHITATDWHQDQGVTQESADDTKMITVWVAVTDATRENGCLQVQPKKKNQELLPHCAKTQVGIPDEFLRGVHSIPLPVGSGGIVIFDPITPHASLANKTDGFRWSFDIRYNVTGQSTGRDHFPSFVARSSSNPASELRDAEEWKRMWENARASLAASQFVDLYRWDSNAPYCA